MNDYFAPDACAFCGEIGRHAATCRNAAPLHAVDAPVGGEALQALFLDAIQWGRSYGQSRNVTAELLQEVAAGFAEKAALASTPSAPGMASVDARDARDAARWRYAIADDGTGRMNWRAVYEAWNGEDSFTNAIDAAIRALRGGTP